MLCILEHLYICCFFFKIACAIPYIVYKSKYHIPFQLSCQKNLIIWILICILIYAVFASKMLPKWHRETPKWTPNRQKTEATWKTGLLGPKGEKRVCGFPLLGGPFGTHQKPHVTFFGELINYVFFRKRRLQRRVVWDTDAYSWKKVRIDCTHPLWASFWRVSGSGTSHRSNGDSTKSTRGETLQKNTKTLHC